jgi:uncharacterized protein
MAYVAQILIEGGISINLRNNDGGTALHMASRTGNEHIANVLIQSGLGINLQNSDGDTVLHIACRNEYQAYWKSLLERRSITEALVEALVRAGADLEVRNKKGETALLPAANSSLGLSSVVRFLLKNGADVRARDDEGRWIKDPADLCAALDSNHDAANGR